MINRNLFAGNERFRGDPWFERAPVAAILLLLLFVASNVVIVVLLFYLSF